MAKEGLVKFTEEAGFKQGPLGEIITSNQTASDRMALAKGSYRTS